MWSDGTRSSSPRWRRYCVQQGFFVAVILIQRADGDARPLSHSCRCQVLNAVAE